VRVRVPWQIRVVTVSEPAMLSQRPGQVARRLENAEILQRYIQPVGEAPVSARHFAGNSTLAWRVTFVT